MYRIEESSFGRYQRLTLSSPDDSQSFSLVPGQAANLLSLRIGGHEWVEGCATPEHLTANPWSRSSLLFPFPNRLRDGRYEWLGQEYQFQTNDTQRNNALHGFAPLGVMPFTVEEPELRADQGTLRTHYTYTGDHAGYPFPFRIDFSVTLRDGGEVSFSLRMENTGTQSIPAGLGYHPYFRVGERVNDYRLQMPGVDMVGVDQRMIPNGKSYDFDRYASAQSIGVDVLDNCFRLRTHAGRVSTVVEGEYGRLELWQEAGPDGYGYLQVFTHPDRTSLALEPMTCNVDAFNNGEGLVTLAPGAAFGGQFGLRVSPA